jgi:hypothetical protein
MPPNPATALDFYIALMNRYLSRTLNFNEGASGRADIDAMGQPPTEEPA